jgi:predicted nucleic acid-binding protein
LIVLDTSAVVEFLAGTDPVAEELRAITAGEKLAAPHAIDLECASTLRGLVHARKLPPDEAQRALQLLGRMQIRRYGHVPLLTRIWQLRHDMWPYDAACVALAELLGADLVTLDAKTEEVSGLMCTVRTLHRRA